MNQQVRTQFDLEIREYRKALSDGQDSDVRARLARAHVLSQVDTFLHLKVHYFMLKFALKKNDPKEILGQVIRLFVTVPGHLTGKVPRGNIGWSNVGLTQEMPIPEDLEKLLK